MIRQGQSTSKVCAVKCWLSMNTCWRSTKLTSCNRHTTEYNQILEVKVAHLQVLQILLQYECGSQIVKSLIV